MGRLRQVDDNETVAELREKEEFIFWSSIEIYFKISLIIIWLFSCYINDQILTFLFPDVLSTSSRSSIFEFIFLNV